MFIPLPNPEKGFEDVKKSSHYFWKFLMLFLAVFCGFMAEYQLEHRIERESEKAHAGIYF